MNPKIIRFPYGINADDVVKSIQDRKRLLIEESEISLNPIQKQLKDSMNAKLLIKIKEEEIEMPEEDEPDDELNITPKVHPPKL